MGWMASELSAISGKEYDRPLIETFQALFRTSLKTRHETSAGDIVRSLFRYQDIDAINVDTRIHANNGRSTG